MHIIDGANFSLCVCFFDVGIVVVGMVEVVDEIAEMEMFRFLTLVIGDVSYRLLAHFARLMKVLSGGISKGD